MNGSLEIVIRADGGRAAEIGTGHIARTLLLADALKKSSQFQGCKIIFATRSDDIFLYSKSSFQEAGYNIFDMKNAEYNSSSELDLLLSIEPDLVIFDRLETSQQLISGLTNKNIKVVTFDDEGDGQPYSDLAIHSLLQNVPESPKTLIGYQYMILPEMPSKPRNVQAEIENIFICFGGYDHKKLTQQFLDLVKNVKSTSHYDVIVGAQTKSSLTEIMHRIGKLREKYAVRIDLHRNPKNFGELLHRSDLAIAAGGLTAFEVVQNAIPCIGIPQYKHQQENLLRLEQKGVIIVCDIGSEKRNTDLVRNMNRIVMDYCLRKNMSYEAGRVIDNNGINRVIEAIGKAAYI